jgi:predicted DNA-binding transcriptional regulator AlpA
MQDLKNASRLLTIKDVARILGISERSIYNGTHRNAKKRFPIKIKRHGKLIRFDANDVQQYIDKL